MFELVRAGGARFRGWPRWVQLAVVVVGIGWFLSSLSVDESDAVLPAGATSTTVTPAPTTTTTTEPRPTTTTSTVTTVLVAPEGGTRASGVELADGPVEDGLGRGAVAYEDLAVLDSLVVAEEAEAASYERSLFRHWDDVDDDGCDTRCEVLTSQRLADGGWFSEWDGATEHDPGLVHIDHVVALAEAWRSGAHAWTAARRDEFADDRANLLAVTATANLRKSDRDAASWFPSRSDANCLWARTVVHVKSAWQLSVDQAERSALANLLTSCGAVPPTTATPTTAAAAPAPAPVPFAAPAPGPSDGCTPGYDPCLPPASDYDCAGGKGDGPEYTGRVTVDPSGGDPYGLDSDGNGVGCERS